MQKVLQTVCKDIGCEIGEIWFVDNKTNTLRLCSICHKPEWKGSEFVEISKKFTFEKGRGLPGHVWEKGQSAWIADVTTDENFPRLPIAFKAGLHGAFAFPIKSSGNVTGVMDFLFRDIKTPDNDLLLMLDALGNQIGAFIEHRQMVVELEKTHKLEAIGTLAGGIAHDFNNLLTAILGNISLTKMHMRPDDKDFKRLTDAENACMQATELSNRLIIFSKGGDPVRKTISINDMVNDTVCSALSGTNISCECKLPPDLNPVYADEGQIRQCFRNMVKNAIEAMPDGGFLKVNAENVMVNDSQPSGLKAGKYVKISIQDTGRGMPEETLSRIFDPYFTTKEMGAKRGLGLGLTVCYSIIKKHEGHISAESKINAGTTFQIYLPAVEAEIKEPVLARAEMSGKKRVLIMDDEALVREVAVRILEHLGYEVEYVVDGHEAVEIYKKTKESGKVFDAVILDLTVRGGMGGDWAIRKLVEADPQVKAIVSSGYADNPVMTSFRKYGFAGAIPKPYNVLQLKEALEKASAGQG